MGDLYSAKSNKQKAMEYYTLALKYGDQPETKAKLEKLKDEK